MEFTRTIVTRICHDMAGAVNAINNGLELLCDDEGAYNTSFDKQAIELVSLSARENMAKLRAIRIIYGLAGDGGESTILQIHEDLMKFMSTNNGKIGFSWSGDFTNESMKISNSLRQLLFNAITVSCSFLVYGGKLDINRSSNRIILSGSAEKICRHDEVELILTKNIECPILSPFNINIIFFMKLFEEFNSSVKFYIGDRSFSMDFLWDEH